MNQQSEHPVCHVCGNNFSSVSNKNRHLRKIHNLQQIEGKITKHVKCPLCTDADNSLTVQQSTHQLTSKEDFEAWRCLSNRNIDYVLERAVKTESAEEYIYYNCNRSNTIASVASVTQNKSAKNGSIKISGLCPSRISVKVNNSGMMVKYIETHVGHNDELHSKRLSNMQQEMLAEKLVAGITNERVLKDAKHLTDGKTLSEVMTESQNTKSIDSSTKREIVLNDALLEWKSLDDQEFYRMAEIINKAYNNSQVEQTQRAEKRKINKQLYYSKRK